MANELAKSEQTFSMALTTSLNDVSEALPKDFNKARFVQNAVALLNDNEQLQKFAKENGTTQIKAGMLKGAYLGLDFMSKEAYLVPYGKTLNFMIDYRGNIKLCKKYSIRPIKDIYAKLVREGDDFSEEIVNGVPSISFKPKPFNNGKIIGAFAVCIYQDGGVAYDTMSKEELDVTRSKSRASNAMAWKDFEGEMYRKTILHRLCKHIEIDFDSPEQRTLFDDEVAISSNPKETLESDVAQNANQETFIDAEVVEAEVIDVDDPDLPDFMKG